jgi:predicted DNA-binding transcriptional regulator AlpA
MHSLEGKALLRLPRVLSLVGVSRSSWWAGVKAGKFPAAIKVSPRVTAWRASDIAELLDRLAGKEEMPNVLN